LLDQGLGRHGEGLAQAIAVAAAPTVDVDRVEAGLVDVVEDQRLLSGAHAFSSGSGWPMGGPKEEGSAGSGELPGAGRSISDSTSAKSVPGRSHSRELAWGSADGRLISCLAGSGSSPSRTWRASSWTSPASRSMGPTKTPSTDTIGAMSHAPRHS